MAQLCYRKQMYFIFLGFKCGLFKKLDSLNLSCKQNCLKFQKCNFEIRKELQLKVYLNYNIPSLQIALRHCLLKCKNNDWQFFFYLMPYESRLQNLNEIDPKSIKSIFFTQP